MVVCLHNDANGVGACSSPCLSLIPPLLPHPLLSPEFENLALREEELPELDTLTRESCPYEVKGGSENKQGKANVLLQVGAHPSIHSTTEQTWN
jgi:hypothetical protein